MYESAGCGSVWLERTAGGREVAGSNPVTPMNKNYYTLSIIIRDQIGRRLLTETGSLSVISEILTRKAMVV